MTRKELLTEAAAWRKMAEWCVKHYGFVCTETEAWSRGWSIPPFEAPWASMHNKVSSMANASREHPGSIWNTTALASPMANKDARVIFCLLMALECEQEARERLR